MRHLDIGVLWLQEQQLRRVVELTKVLGTSNPADLMTKHRGQEALNQYAVVLQYDFRKFRSATIARLHGAHERAPHRPPSISSEGEPTEAKQWQCMGTDHWRSTRQGARAFRSPRAAGVQWSEVARRTTREPPKFTVIDDIYPLRDGIEEATACPHIGGSKDIQTHIYTVSKRKLPGTPCNSLNQREVAHQRVGIRS